VSCNFGFQDPYQVSQALTSPTPQGVGVAVTIAVTEAVLRVFGLSVLPEGVTIEGLQTLVQELLQDTPVRRRNATRLACHEENVSEDAGCGCMPVEDAREMFDDWSNSYEDLRRANVLVGGITEPCQGLMQAANNALSQFHQCALDWTEGGVVCPKAGGKPKRCRIPGLVKKCVAYEGDPIPTDPGTFTSQSDWWNNPDYEECQYCAANPGNNLVAGGQALNLMLTAIAETSQLLQCGQLTSRLEADLARCEYIRQTVGNISTAGKCPKKCIAWRFEAGDKWVNC